MIVTLTGDTESPVAIRAERRMGEVIREMPGHGSHGGDRKSTSTKQVEPTGISHSMSIRCQAIAAVLEPGPRNGTLLSEIRPDH